MNNPKKIRWLIAHEPIELFLRTAEAFSAKLNEIVPGRFEVEIYTVSQYLEKFGDTVKVPNEMHLAPSVKKYQTHPISNMDDGLLEMSQLNVGELAKLVNSNFWALELPFIFRDHDHAQKVLEGEIGKGLLNSLKENSPCQGLAFTYSGGFRCVVSETELKNLEDFKGVRFGSLYSPVIVDTIKALGAESEVFSYDEFHGIDVDKESKYLSPVVETTIPRFLAELKGSAKRFMLNTKHNMFLTSIIASNTFLESLSKEDRDAIDQAVLFASRAERKWSVTEAEEFAAKADHTDIGIEFAELSQEETEKFKNLVQPVINRYREFFYPGLVDGIIKS